MFSLTELQAAHATVLAAMPATPQFSWPLLARRLQADVIVKHENHTPTGAFKVRGGLTYVDRLKRERPHVAGLILATRGNHGQSLAFAGRRHTVPVTIYVPEGNATEKNSAMKAFGATLVEHGVDFQEAREEAMRQAGALGLEMVPSFHRDLVLGVSTYAYELMTAHPDLDRIYVPIGQGSGACGCIMARDLLGLETEIVGVQSVGAPAYSLSLKAGHIVRTETATTNADGMATRAPDEDAFAIIKQGIARIVEVNDAEIAAAIRAYWTDTHNLAEGAGAAPLAAAYQEREQNQGRKIGLILCGGNIDFDLFQSWVAPTSEVALPFEKKERPEKLERAATIATQSSS